MAYSYSDITFLENPFSFSVALKTSLEPLRTIFPWCPLGLHLGSGQCPFNQEKCLRRCGIEETNKIGTGSLTLTLAVSSLWWITWPNCSCWHYWSLSIGRGMIMLYPVITKKRDGLVRWRRTVPIFFIVWYYLDYKTNGPLFLRKSAFLLKVSKK